MTFKQLLGAASAAAFGAVAGSLITAALNRPGSVTSGTILAREIVILDEYSHPAARLTSFGGSTVLRFYTAESTPAVDVGIADRGASRFVRFFGKGGGIVAALNSLPPHGESTLYIGDERWASRIIIGALQTDIPGPQSGGVNDWGLQLRKPRSTQSLFSVLVKSPPLEETATAGLLFVRSDGKVWTLH